MPGRAGRRVLVEVRSQAVRTIQHPGENPDAADDACSQEAVHAGSETQSGSDSLCSGIVPSRPCPLKEYLDGVLPGLEGWTAPG